MKVNKDIVKAGLIGAFEGVGIGLVVTAAIHGINLLIKYILRRIDGR